MKWPWCDMSIDWHVLKVFSLYCRYVCCCFYACLRSRLFTVASALCTCRVGRVGKLTEVVPPLCIGFLTAKFVIEMICKTPQSPQRNALLENMKSLCHAASLCLLVLKKITSSLVMRIPRESSLVSGCLN